MSEQVKLSAFLVQGCAALIICFLSTLTGCTVVWPSYTIAIYQSNATYLDAPITTSQVSMLGSIINVGGLVGTPLSAYMVDKIGRKYSAMLFGLPYVMTWALISITTSYNVVLFAVGFAGFSAASQSVSLIYISEIAHVSNRGALTSGISYGYIIGVLFSYIFGGYLSYYSILYVHLALSVLYILLLIPLKESPCYLLKCGKEQEARESLAFYRRMDVDSKEVEREIRNLRLQLGSNINNILNADETNLATDATNDSQEISELIKQGVSRPVGKKTLSAWQYLRQSESSRRALITVTIVMTSMVLMGTLAIQVFAESLFKEAIPTMHPSTCSILLAADYLIASLIGASAVDRLGRKFLLTITAFITGIFTLLIGTQLHLHWAPHWVTAVLIYSHSFVFNIGVSQIPFVLAAEVFLPEVRALGNSIVLGLLWISNWILVATFFSMVEFFGLGPTFYIFSVACFFGSVYSHLCLPETKGLSADAIQFLFIKKKRDSPPKV